MRKISYGEGVERVFPLLSPMIDSIKLVRRGKVRRAKLYYLRGLRGKSARIAEGAHHGTPEHRRDGGGREGVTLHRAPALRRRPACPAFFFTEGAAAAAASPTFPPRRDRLKHLQTSDA